GARARRGPPRRRRPSRRPAATRRRSGRRGGGAAREGGRGPRGRGGRGGSWAAGDPVEVGEAAAALLGQRVGLGRQRDGRRGVPGREEGEVERRGGREAFGDAGEAGAEVHA